MKRTLRASAGSRQQQSDHKKQSTTRKDNKSNSKCDTRWGKTAATTITNNDCVHWIQSAMDDISLGYKCAMLGSKQKQGSNDSSPVKEQNFSIERPIDYEFALNKWLNKQLYRLLAVRKSTGTEQAVDAENDHFLLAEKLERMECENDALREELERSINAKTDKEEHMMQRIKDLEETIARLSAI